MTALRRFARAMLLTALFALGAAGICVGAFRLLEVHGVERPVVSLSVVELMEFNLRQLARMKGEGGSC